MVLKKPYAFLIKHFRLIHLFLLGFLLYVFNKSYSVFKFFDTYLNSSKLNLIDNLSSQFITPFMFIVTIMIILVTLTIMLLMNFKKKNTKYYLICIIFYFILIFVFIFTSYQLKQIEWNQINVQLIKITRDMLLVGYLFQIPFMIVSLVRAIGFNIRKFNFERDLKELDIDEFDSEEFEVGVNLDNNDIKTIINRRKRVLKYFVKENKYVVILFIGLLMIGSGLLIYINKEVYHKVYEENEELNTPSIKIKVLNSYQLDTNSSNNDITDGLYSFTVVKVLLTNNTKTNLSINLNNFRLSTKEFTTYKVDTSSYKQFIEFGAGYNGEEIKSLESKDYILVFKIKKEEKTNSKLLEYLTSTKLRNKELVYNYAKFKLNTDTLAKNETVKEVNLNEKIDFSNSLLKNTNITIRNVEIDNNFVENNKKCINNKCYDSSNYIVPTSISKYKKMVMKVDYELELDKTINQDVKNSFIARFANIRYVINNKEYYHDINLVDITPYGLNDVSYLEVKDEVNKANKIYLDIRIRNKIYTYIIRG